MATIAMDKHEVDLTKGAIFPMLIKFAIPFVIANVLTLLFQAADIATLRFMVGGDAVAAVSATGSLTALFINFFIGFSMGASVVLSKCVGKNDTEKARKVVGTSIALSIVAGIALMVIGWFGAETFLRWMDCPEEVLEKATIYVRIYLLGAPIILFYNLGAGILRAVGDSLRPMIYLAISGVANVGLNVFFIVVFDMTVEGVAIGTVGSQLIVAVLILIAMRKSKGFSRLEYKNLRFYKTELLDIVRIGLPTAIQTSLFSISNVLISSAINSHGKFALEGAGGAAQIDAFIYTIGNAVANASMSIVSQNVGAKKMDRVKKVMGVAILSVIVLEVLMGAMVLIFAKPLISLFVASPEAFVYAQARVNVLAFAFIVDGAMEIFQYSLRAMGKSTTSMLLAIFFVCVFRIIWLNTFYLLNSTMVMIFLSYPITWTLNLLAHAIITFPLIKKLKVKFESENSQELIKQTI